jgi:hypothetical protein
MAENMNRPDSMCQSCLDAPWSRVYREGVEILTQSPGEQDEVSNPFLTTTLCTTARGTKMEVK